MRFATGYSIVVGILILAQWAFFLAAGAVPEVRTAPWSIGFHLAAEFALALALIVGRLATWQTRKWGVQVLLVGLGMAIYSEIASPGYFAQQGIWMLVGMFAVLLTGALVSVWKLNHHKENGP